MLDKVFKDPIKMRSRYHIWTCIVHASVSETQHIESRFNDNKEGKKADAKKVKVVPYIPNEEIF